MPKVLFIESLAVKHFVYRQNFVQYVFILELSAFFKFSFCRTYQQTTDIQNSQFLQFRFYLLVL